MFSIPRILPFLVLLLSGVIANGQSALPTPPEWQSPHSMEDLQAAKTALIPFPRQVTWGKSDITVPQDVTIVVDDNTAKSASRGLARLTAVLQQNGISAKAAAKPSGKTPAIFITLDTSITPQAEGYSLKIDTSGIHVRGKDAAGIYYAVQTLRQMLRQEDSTVKIQQAEISDYPAFPMRGFMHDTGRNFQTIESLKAQIDHFAEYKLNTFQWHLTDNPAWRIESKIYPKLNDPQYRRAGRDPECTYTFNQIREVIAYARDRHITIIPELDMPGHSEFFNKTFGFAMASPEGMKIIEELIDEFCREIPAEDCPILHIGSDEVRIKNPDEFMQRMLARTRKNGRMPMVWNPGLKADDETLEQIWREGIQSQKHAENKAPFVDSASGYLNIFDAVAMVQRQFFMQPCFLPKGDTKARGAILCCWPDARVDDKAKILSHNAVWPGMLAFSESVWCGRPQQPGNLVAFLPTAPSTAWQFYNEFEKRLSAHRDKYFAGEPFPYAAHSRIVWQVSDPFLIPKDAPTDQSFPPETAIQDTYTQDGKTIGWRNVSGGTVSLRDRAGNGVFGKIVRGSVYALTYLHSDTDKTIHARIGFETPARSQRQCGGIPPAGKWDAHGGTVWINDRELPAPVWKNPGKHRYLNPTWFAPPNEIPYEDEEFYWAREPVQVPLKAGWNKVLLRVPCTYGNQNWTFAFTPVTKSPGGHWVEDTSVLFSTHPSSSAGFQPACNQASTPSQETTDKRIKKRINGYQQSSHAIPARKRVSLLSSCYLYYIREIRGSVSF
ncbi:MAG: beta-N-acetylhexosaminidase [Puniceicoccales bacterium]|jgi:hypothetical protein|nr:beta-N-acetylhexosaminidase [Puniceicoccales bacterium]